MFIHSWVKSFLLCTVYTFIIWWLRYHLNNEKHTITQLFSELFNLFFIIFHAWTMKLQWKSLIFLVNIDCLPIAMLETHRPHMSTGKGHNTQRVVFWEDFWKNKYFENAKRSRANKGFIIYAYILGPDNIIYIVHNLRITILPCNNIRLYNGRASRVIHRKYVRV